MFSVIVQGTTSGLFKCKIRLRQGDVLVTEIFNFLFVNNAKAKFHMIAAYERTWTHVCSHLVIDDKSFEVLNNLVKLGVLISNNYALDIKRRILAAQRGFFAVRH